MRDWFDLNNDGKLDTFEEACKWSHINNSVKNWENENKTKNTYKSPSSNNGKNELGGWKLFFLIIVVYLAAYLLHMINMSF